jgi:hypothetical protein
MRKLIIVAMFTMFAGVASAQDVDSRDDGVQAAPDLGAAQEPGEEAVPLNDYCYDVWAACTAECWDLFGPAKAACLRLCRIERDECLDN